MSREAIRAFDRALVASLLAQAAEHPRRRINLDLHDGHEALVHRFIIAMQPDTYVRPHLHPQPHKLEMAVWLAGEMEWIFFGPDGTVQRRVAVGGASGCWSVEVPPGVFHSVIAHTPAAFLEVKQGPYDARSDKTWADWAPAEYSAEAAAYRDGMKTR